MAQLVRLLAFHHCLIINISSKGSSLQSTSLRVAIKSYNKIQKLLKWVQEKILFIWL
ncbi:hypothetical protein KSS87_000580 [Heliosperma pusillum]|nr:hypothetical protein KSS87_000580 [Heliosperma pusillum]